jgi:DNA repair protein RadC
MKTQQTTISEVRLVYRTKVKASDRLQVKCSKDAFEIFMEGWDPDSIEHVEEFKLMLLNGSNRILGISSLSKGGTTGTVVDVKLLLQYTIKVNAYAIILCHNHPSGSLQPRDADLEITRKVDGSAKIMDVQLLDHLIIVPEGKYYSMQDEGRL